VRFGIYRKVLRKVLRNEGASKDPHPRLLFQEQKVLELLTSPDIRKAYILRARVWWMSNELQVKSLHYMDKCI
jgi:hypothetical protein